MKDTKEVTALVIDFGIYIHVARRLAKDFAHVFYCTPWETAFPRVKDAVVGDGYQDITWVEHSSKVLDYVDLVVFPDIGFSYLQNRIAKTKPVWGCRQADTLEAHRGAFLESLKEAGLPVPEFKEIMGVTNLRLYLADKEDVFIKCSSYRGDFETFHFQSMKEDEHFIDSWAVKLGPLRELMAFFVFEKIETEIEDGIDTWCIDGQWPDMVWHGIEAKDKAFIGTFQKMSELSEEVSVVNRKYAKILEQYGYRGAFSTEVRITPDHESYFIDPTCRFGSPPSQVMMDTIGNWGEIVWKGANGILVEPEIVHQFGAQAIFKVDRDDWCVLDIPDEIKDWVCVGFSCQLDGKICVPPDPMGVSEIGWVRGAGSTIQGAVENLKEHVDRMPGCVHVEYHAVAEVLKEIVAEQEMGIEFSKDEPPPPEIVLKE
jgi:hypothetical protein